MTVFNIDYKDVWTHNETTEPKFLATIVQQTRHRKINLFSRYVSTV